MNMTHEEENKKIAQEISSLKAENDVFMQMLENEYIKQQQQNAGISHSGLFTSGYFHNDSTLASAIKSNIANNNERISILQQKLKQNRVERALSGFFEKNPVEHVGGRIYRGTFWGLIVFAIIRSIVAFLILMVIAIVVCGIGAIFK